MNVTHATLSSLTPCERVAYAERLAACLDIATAMCETTPNNRTTDNPTKGHNPMTRKHFDTLFAAGSLFCVSAPTATPTEHGSATFRLSLAYPSRNRPNSLVLSLWTGFGNGEKHAGSATPSADSREAVPTSDPKRSGRATRDGWQPVALVNTDALTASFVTRSVDDSRFVAHVAAGLVAQGYAVEGVNYAVTIFGARETRTTLSRTGVPHSPTFRNTEANTATHRNRAQAGGNRLMEFGANGGR